MSREDAGRNPCTKGHSPGVNLGYPDLRAPPFPTLSSAFLEAGRHGLQIPQRGQGSDWKAQRTGVPNPQRQDSSTWGSVLWAPGSPCGQEHALGQAEVTSFSGRSPPSLEGGTWPSASQRLSGMVEADTNPGTVPKMPGENQPLTSGSSQSDGEDTLCPQSSILKCQAPLPSLRGETPPSCNYGIPGACFHEQGSYLGLLWGDISLCWIEGNKYFIISVSYTAFGI